MLGEKKTAQKELEMATSKISNFCVFNPIWMKFGKAANIGQKAT